MPENPHLRFLLRLLYAGLGLAGLWVSIRFLLPWLFPFLVAFGLASLLEPAVRLLAARLRLPRWAGAALCTLLLSVIILGLLGLLLWRTVYELSLLLGRLPTLLAGLPTLANALENQAYRFVIALPVQLQELAQQTLEELLAQGISLPNRFYDMLVSTVSHLISALPAAILSLFTTFLATYFISASRPQLLSAIRGNLPARWQETITLGSAGAKRVLGGWLRAQGVLILITFAEVAVGLLLLQIDLALLIAGLTALVDALPVFGAGAVLLPWAFLAFVSGKRTLCLGLLILYGVVTLVRNLLEPKLVGRQVGLPPLLSLLCMYVGFQVFGVLGMILAPLAAVLARQFWQSKQQA